ncbi:MAG: virulence protein [Eubacteriales bacterium]|nr:virulence protein [Eubacteriales bacterium]
MTFHYHVTGNDRKRLVAAISEITEVPAKYLGAPTFAYEVDYFTIDKNGYVSFDDTADSEEVEMLVERLLEMGFEPEGTKNENVEVDGICISVPKNLFTEQALENLKNIVTAKCNLIKKVFGVSELPVEIDEYKISFPWFPGQPTPEELKAYESFICALCKIACDQKRINAKEKETYNEKYTFRCFLLRLGFIGNEYKQVRKILLRNLSCSSAFKGGAKDALSE